MVSHWVRIQSDMATIACDSGSHGYWNGLQSVHGAYFRRRECTCLDPWRPCHELADVDGVWHLPWLLRQPGRIQHRAHLVETSIGQCFHTRGAFGSWNLLLSWYFWSYTLMIGSRG